MKSNFTFKAFGFILNGITKKAIKDGDKAKAIMKEYKSIVERAKDIGAKNNLLGSYALCAYYIAMVRNTGLPPQENADIIGEGIKESGLIKLTLGDANSYFAEKRMDFRYKWAEETHKHLYENDWEVDILPKTDAYEMGYDYTQCGVCKLCKDEGCPELAKYMCQLDFLLVEVMGLRLERTTTLAEGGEKCDFRFHKK